MKRITIRLPFIIGAIVGSLFTSCDNYQPTGEEGILIDIDIRYQTIEGFGSCVVNYKDFPETYSDPEFLDRVVNDLGLSIVRIPLMEHLEWENDDDDPNHFNWDGFWLHNNIERKGLEESMNLLQKFKDRGVKRFMATPWSPPDYLKTTRAPIQGGYLRADMLDEYAEYLAAQIILAKKNYGIDLNWVGLQNELLFVQFYRSCVYNPWLLKETLKTVSKKFKKEGINSKILMPEDMMFVDRMLYHIDPTMNDPETRNFNGAFGAHRKDGRDGLETWVAETSKYHKQNWMTETSGHPQTWKGALKLANDIQDYLVYGNFSAWVYWQIDSKEPGGDFSILIDGLPSPKYYASKHFYKYIRPGAVRVAATSQTENLHVSAYHHEVDGTMTIVLINNSDSTIQTSLNTPYKFDIYQSTAVDKFANKGQYLPGAELVIPGKGIVTLNGTDRKLKTLKSLSALPESWIVPEDQKSEKWGNDSSFPRKTPFQVATDEGYGNIMWNRLQKESPEDIQSHVMHNGWTWMHNVLLNGDGASLKLLLEKGADINAKANDGWTPLHMAASSFVDGAHNVDTTKDYKKFELLRILLDEGADFTATTDDGWTALHAAAANAYTGWRQNSYSSLQRIRDLIEVGVDLEAKDVSGKTALHYASMQGYLYFSGVPEVSADVVEVLLDAGADINNTDHSNRTALHYAVEIGYCEIVLSLVKHGADQSLADVNGKTALDIALKSELKTIIYILENGAFPDDKIAANSVDNHGTSTKYKDGPELLKAAWNGDIEKVKKLLADGADVAYTDTDGFTAKARAKDSGHEDIVKLLEAAEDKK